MSKIIQQGFVIHVIDKDKENECGLWPSESWPVFVKSIDEAEDQKNLLDAISRARKGFDEAVITPCRATISWLEPFPVEEKEYCNCQCHITPGIMHFMACCEGACLKCERYIKRGLVEHMKHCQDFNNPQKLYDALQKANEEVQKLRGENNFLKTIYNAVKANEKDSTKT